MLKFMLFRCALGALEMNGVDRGSIMFHRRRSEQKFQSQVAKKFTSNINFFSLSSIQLSYAC